MQSMQTLGFNVLRGPEARVYIRMLLYGLVGIAPTSLFIIPFVVRVSLLGCTHTPEIEREALLNPASINPSGVGRFYALVVMCAPIRFISSHF